MFSTRLVVMRESVYTRPEEGIESDKVNAAKSIALSFLNDKRPQ